MFSGWAAGKLIDVHIHDTLTANGAFDLDGPGFEEGAKLCGQAT